MDRFSEVAELESSLKVKRLERDIPKYLRAQNEWMQELKDVSGSQEGAEGENTSYQRESIEELLQTESKKSFSTSDKENPVRDFEPVLYEIVTDAVAASKDREGLSSI